MFVERAHRQQCHLNEGKCLEMGNTGDVLFLYYLDHTSSSVVSGMKKSLMFVQQIVGILYVVNVE